MESHTYPVAHRIISFNQAVSQPTCVSDVATSFHTRSLSIYIYDPNMHRHLYFWFLLFLHIFLEAPVCICLCGFLFSTIPFLGLLNIETLLQLTHFSLVHTSRKKLSVDFTFLPHILNSLIFTPPRPANFFLPDMQIRWHAWRACVCVRVFLISCWLASAYLYIGVQNN